MDDVFESLTKEVKIIQSRDPHFKGRRHVPDSYFYTDLYKEELKNTSSGQTESILPEVIRALAELVRASLY